MAKIEHNGILYTTAHRKATVGEKVIVVNSANTAEYENGEIHTITGVVTETADVVIAHTEARADYLFHEEYDVLEPVTK